MIVSNISDEIYKGAGWAVAAIVDNEVIAIAYHPEGHEAPPALNSFAPLHEAVEADPAYIAAKVASEAAWEALEAAEANGDDDTEALEAEAERLAVKVRHGMAGSLQFTHTFSRREAKQIGIAHPF